MPNKITFEDARNMGEEKRKQILSHFGEKDTIDKAISFDEFDEKYGAGHEVFTVKNINDYIAKATEEDSSDEIVKAIEDELTGLEKVFVKSEGSSVVEPRYVRKAVVSEDPKEEGKDNKEEAKAEK